MASLAPATCDYIRALARKLETTPHKARGPLIDGGAEFLGMSKQTIYRHLKAVAGWESGRKCRADKGSTSVNSDALLTLATMQRESVRDNGKQTMHTPVARSVLEANGLPVGVSNAHLNRLMRDRGLNVETQVAASPAQKLRYPHPNHTHQVDPSLCLVYYLNGRQYIMEDREFYKNKLENYAKVKFKVFRYAMWDGASGSIQPWYTEAAGESQASLFNFLMHAWSKQDGRLFHGVPKVLIWDKGSANQSHAIRNLLKSLEVEAITHEAGNSRAKGGVENANNIIETQFESRLRFEPVDSIDELNAAALAWSEGYNANLIPGQDTRLRREGLAMPVARYDLWQRIRSEELRLLPDVEVCRALMVGKEEERKVDGHENITFRHPKADRTQTYCLKGMEGVNVGDMVSVRPLVYGDDAIQVALARFDGEPLIYRVEPEREYDGYGNPLSAAVPGEGYKSHAQTPAEVAGQAMDELAFPGQDADQARQKKVVPFGGAIKSHSYLKDVEQPSYLQRPGVEIEAPAHAAPAAPRMLDSTVVMLRVRSELGRNLTAEENQFMTARFAGGVPEDQLDALIDQFKNPPQAQDVQPLRAAGGLRAV
ncbi:integrase [Comamonas thiooxydans]|uniref:integrase n=1 Tax=Comamonas thiooxydans TaxID=363952 RepID=UPI001CCA5A6F|nr:integrase [Comamonas thiooxydans]UBQ43977.1 integrase [Comamonas thiooxydans]